MIDVNRREELEELKFTKYLESKGGVKTDHSSRSSLIFWKREYRLHRPMELLKREFYDGDDYKRKAPIGRIDLVFRYRGKLWCGEVKYYLPHSTEFWDACKIIAYTQYFNWQSDTMESFEHAYPAVLVPHESIILEHKIIAARLKILLFGICKTDTGYTLTEHYYPAQ